jgi:quercetin dioxygenase-like cupin family protein
MSTPEVKIGLVANLFSKMMVFKAAGDVEQGHTHSFDHLTLLAAGGLIVRANGYSTTFTAPAMIYIRADVQHELEATAPDTVAYCIHALRNPDKSGDVIDPSMVPAGVKLRTLIADGVVDNVLNPPQTSVPTISGVVPVTVVG